MKPSLANACVIALLMSGSAHAQEGATIYRCIGSDGVARFGHLQCSPGERQETRGVIPPSDPIPSPPPTTQAPAAPEPAPPVPDPPPTVVVMHTPQPLYECTTPEGIVMIVMTILETPDGCHFGQWGGPHFFATGALIAGINMPMRARGSGIPVARSLAMKHVND